MPDGRQRQPERDFWDRLPVALYRTTPAGEILDVNQEFVRLFGYPDRESLLRTHASALHGNPEDRERWKECFARDEVLRGLDLRLRRADGTTFAGRETARAVRGDHSSVEFYEGMVEDVTEDRRADEALRESQRLLAQAQRVASVGSWSWNVVKNTVTWSEELYRIFARSPEEFPATFEGYLSCVHPEDRERVRQHVEHALRGQTTFSTQARIVRPSGEIRWLQSRGELLLDEGGAPREMAGVCHDITEQKAAEEGLREREERFRRFFELGIVGMAMTSPTKGWLEVNDEICRILGYGRDDLRDKTWADLTHPDDLAADTAQFERVLSGELDAYSMEKRFIRKDGQVVDATISVRCLRRPDGSVDYLVGLLQDITSRKRAEEGRDLLSRVVEQTAESIVITDPEGTIAYVNPAFERLSGYTRAEAVGQNARILKSGHQDAAFYRRMWDTLSRGEVWSGTLVNRRKDTTLFQEHATIGPVHDAAGRLVNYVAVKRDTTHEASLERQLLQAQKMEAVGRLAGGIAHDFNNILGVISGYGAITLKQLPAEDPLRRKVEQILRAAERAAGLTRQLLAFSRHQVLQPRIIDLNVIVSDMDQMLRRVIGEDVELVTLLRPGVWTVKADPGQIEQALMNLVVNARDAMPKGGRITIETQNVEVGLDPTQRPGPYAMIVVSDTGVGMDAETQSHAFEPFFTTKELGKGTGLGLSSVYGIFKQSEGYVFVYSEVGIGTTFKLYLPRVEGEASAIRVRRIEAPPRGHETVLLIEDEASLRDVLSETLEGGGYTVLVARDGVAAIELAGGYAGPIQLIVTDVIMPRMAGHEVVRQIVPIRPETKVLYISGYTDEAIAKHGILTPGATFLSKPFSPETLLLKIREILDAP